MRILKTFDNGSCVYYDKGKFDDWCLYYKDNNVIISPKDHEYFESVLALSKLYGIEKVYFYFIQIYLLTTREENSNIYNFITEWSKKQFSEHFLEADLTYSVLYATMLSEENKTFTKLGKRVKRLGIEQILIDGLDINFAANFSKEKNGANLIKYARREVFS